MTPPFSRALAALVMTIATAAAGPPSAEEGQRRQKKLADTKAAMAAEPTAAGRMTLLAKAMKGEPVADVRRILMHAVPGVPAPEVDAFLTGILTADPDAGIRSVAADTLGRVGTSKALPALAKAAAEDADSDILMGCMGGTSNARRSATFAVAELAARHPAIQADAVAKLRALAPPDDPADRHSLADARRQSLYQLTRDPALLAPFFEKLKSPVVRTRQDGVIAFRFLKTRTAPPEVVAMMKDADPEVVTWTALTLGEIADPATVPALQSLAIDRAATKGPRCNAISALGSMKATAKPAATALRELLTDPDEQVQLCAAVAVYQITSEKTPKLPAGYIRE